MRIVKHFIKRIAFTLLLVTGITTLSIAQDTTTIINPEADTPVILTTSPTSGEMNVELNSNIEITFSSKMDEATLNDTTLLLKATAADSKHKELGEMMDDPMNEKSAFNDSEKILQDTADAVNGTISYSNKVAVFTPGTELKKDTQYTFTVTNGVKNMENNTLENHYTWSFKTMGSSDSTYTDMQEDKNSLETTEYGEGSMDTLYTTDTMETEPNGENNMIDLGKASQFVILAKTTVNNESTSRITGQVGEGSAADSLDNKTANDAYSVRQTQNTLVQNAMVQNTMVHEGQSETTSPDVTEALEDMMTAYSNVSMQNGDDSTSQMNDNFHDAELSSGIHEWSDSLNIKSDITLAGSADDVWVFKVGDNLTVDENTVFTLTDGARADNIFWVVEGEVTIGENTKFEGIILSKNDITLEKGASLNGRIFSQTSITLNDNTVTEPGNMTGQRTSTNR